MNEVMEVDDMMLVREFAGTKSDRAFSEIVSRHAALVYSVALRQVRDPQLAQDVTQAVFIVLARKATDLGRNTILPAWLCRTARFVSSDALKRQYRRREREQEAHMQARLNEPESGNWEKISPLLDFAMERLGSKEHDALVLRFFKGRTFAEVGEALGISEAAAKMRVSRGIEKLRAVFQRKGITMSSAVLVSTVAWGGIPSELTASSVIVVGKAGGGTALVLANAALKSMAWASAKAWIGTGAAAMVVAGAVSATVFMLTPVPWQVYPPPAFVLNRARPQVEVLPTKFPSRGQYRLVGSGRMLGLDISLEEMIRNAFGVSPGRMILPSAFPQTFYDYIANLRSGSSVALQQKIREVTGFAGHRETREMDVLVLKIARQNAPGLRRANSGFANSGQFGVSNFSATHRPISDLVDYLEHALSLPVVDETGLSGDFDIDVEWNNPTGNVLDPAAMKRALLDQLGLKLVSARRRLEMLVVENAADPHK